MTTLSDTYHLNPNYVDLLSVDGLKALIADMDDSDHLYHHVLQHMPERIGEYWFRMMPYMGKWYVGYYGQTTILIQKIDKSHKEALFQLYDELSTSGAIDKLIMITK